MVPKNKSSKDMGLRTCRSSVENFRALAGLEVQQFQTWSHHGSNMAMTWSQKVDGSREHCSEPLKTSKKRDGEISQNLASIWPKLSTNMVLIIQHYRVLLCFPRIFFQWKFEPFQAIISKVTVEIAKTMPKMVLFLQIIRYYKVMFCWLFSENWIHLRQVETLILHN